MEDWLSLDVNGRNGKGAFTFSYASNESDFANANPTRLGHIVIQNLNSMKADTLYVRQQGTPDGKEYESYDNSNYIEFIDAALNRVTVVYADFDGVTDAASVSAWIEETGVDGIMIGRASLGNPWIFSEVQQYLNTCFLRSGGVYGLVMTS